MTGYDHPSGTEVRSLACVDGDGAEVRVRYVDTPKGERLEFESDQGSVRLDAVALECLAYLDKAGFEAFFTPGESSARDAPTVLAKDDGNASTDLASITNEFAHVNVRKSALPTRDVLELTAPKAGLKVSLTAAALERITAKPQAAFTELVRQRVE